MKTFKQQWPQGDLYAIRLPDTWSLPKGAQKVPPQDGKIIVAHSESGHHHVMDARYVDMYRLPEEIYECFLIVKEPTPLVHERDWATHESVIFRKGNHKIRRQREHIPEGMRRVED